MKRISIPLVLFAVRVLWCADILGAEVYDLRNLVDRALSQTERIQSHKAVVQEKEQAAQQLQAWQNPSLSLGLGAKVASPSVGPVFQAAVSQPITFPGKQDLRFGVASVSKQMAQLGVQETENAIINDVVQLAFQYANVKRKQAFAQKRSKRSDLVRSYLQGHAFVSPQAQAIKLLINEKLRALEVGLFELEALEGELKSKITFYLNEPGPSELEIKVPWLKGRRFASSHETAEKIEESLVVQMDSLELAKAKAELKLADRDFWPDFTLSGFYNYEATDKPEHIFGLRFSLPIPLWDQSSQLRHSHKHKVRAKEIGLDFQRRQVASQINQGFIRYELARKTVEQYPGELIAILEKRLADAELALRKGRLDISMFLDVEEQVSQSVNRVFDAQVELVESMTHLHALTYDRNFLAELIL